MKQNVELPNACLSTNIGLETNCRSYKPQNVPIPYGHVSQCFFAFPVIGILDQTCDVHLFTLQHE
jgi:hypothetical protein